MQTSAGQLVPNSVKLIEFIDFVVTWRALRFVPRHREMRQNGATEKLMCARPIRLREQVKIRLPLFLSLDHSAQKIASWRSLGRRYRVECIYVLYNMSIWGLDVRFSERYAHNLHSFTRFHKLFQKACEYHHIAVARSSPNYGSFAGLAVSPSSFVLKQEFSGKSTLYCLHFYSHLIFFVPTNLTHFCPGSLCQNTWFLASLRIVLGEIWLS